jgi:putative AlgH/UPF0301 family transcriptional regulator
MIKIKSLALGLGVISFTFEDVVLKPSEYIVLHNEKCSMELTIHQMSGIKVERIINSIKNSLD